MRGKFGVVQVLALHVVVLWVAVLVAFALEGVLVRVLSVVVVPVGAVFEDVVGSDRPGPFCVHSASHSSPSVFVAQSLVVRDMRRFPLAPFSVVVCPRRSVVGDFSTCFASFSIAFAVARFSVVVHKGCYSQHVDHHN